MTISPAEIAAARRLLGWSRGDLAKYSGVRPALIDALETGGRLACELYSDEIRKLFESTGVEFMPENGGGVRVRIRRAKPGPIARGDLKARTDD